MLMMPTVTTALCRISELVLPRRRVSVPSALRSSVDLRLHAEEVLLMFSKDGGAGRGTGFDDLCVARRDIDGDLLDVASDRVVHGDPPARAAGDAQVGDRPSLESCDDDETTLGSKAGERRTRPR